MGRIHLTGGPTVAMHHNADSEGIAAVQGELEDSLRPELEVLRFLGAGTTAYVFLAREPALRRLVAVKLLRPNVGWDETARARFEREAHCEAGIAHPCVPTVYRVGRIESGLPYLVQEFIEGRTLRDRLEAVGRLRPSEARRILADVAGALAAAHAQGVIHRDVRPGNVMLRRDSGRAVLMDFGIAAVRESASGAATRLTGTGEILGDPRYASPELLQGATVTAETDVYSLGILGYEVLTETNPFGSRSVEELVQGHLGDQPVDLPWEVSVADPELGELLKRCLRKEPAHRPRAADVRDALTGGASGGGTDLSPEDASTHGDSLVRAFPGLAGLVDELRRRHVYQVGALYLVAGIGLIEVAGNILEGLSAPAWIYSSLIIAVLAGFPVTLALAWVYDLTSGGIRKTRPENGSTQSREGSGRALRLIALLVSTAVVAGLGWLLFR